MRNAVYAYLTIQFVIYLQFTVFFLRPFDITAEAEIAKAISTDINIFFYSVSIFLCFYLKDKVLLILRQVYILWIIVLYCIMSVVWSDLPSVSVSKVFNLLLQLVQMLAVVASVWHWQINILSLLRKVTSIIILGNTLFYFLNPTLALSKALGEDGRYDCLMPSPNNLAQMAIITIALRLPRKLVDISLKDLVPVLCSLFCLYLSGSATGLICILLLLSINTSLTIKRAWRTLVMIAVSLAGITVTLFTPQSKLDIFSLFNRDANLTGRTIIWASSLVDVAKEDRILQGFGFGGFWDSTGKQVHSNEFLDGFMQAHNGYLDIYIQLGIVGFFLLILFTVNAIKLIYKNINEEIFRNECLLLIGILINNLTESSLFSPKHPNWLLFTVIYFLLSSSFYIFNNYKRNNLISHSENSVNTFTLTY